jgi:TonB family protein
MYQPATSHRALALIIVAALHLAVAYVLAHSTAHRTPSSLEDHRLVTVFIQPKIRDDLTLPGPNLSRITYRATVRPPLLHIDGPIIDFDVARNNSAGMAAPTREILTGTDMAPYIKRAALLPGEGATVVLRIEVLVTGDPGRIEIDISSGSQRVDQAAVAYAHTQHWQAGRVNGVRQVMWIRWGVRLQA